ncbi:ROK family protein [Microbacterium indicum]|uniref:ROK family protein n=1 Tax=Microbacterium indicum TaxID=358100 RepID=UPI000400E2E1|nr:ROK family protein [Microbacterium indicum]
MTGVRVGIDIGGTKVEAVALDASGAVVARDRRPTDPGPDGVVRSALASVRALAAEPASIGIGIPGMVEGGVVRGAVNLGIAELPLADVIAAETGAAVGVENDVRAAAVGASHVWETPTIALLNLGTGVAAGVVVAGRLLSGRGGAAGEIGHFSIDQAGPACACGQRGCIEAYAGGRALALRAGMPAAAAFAAAASGDARARGAVRDAVSAAASAVEILALSIDPPVVAVAGGMARAGGGLRDELAGELDRRAASSPFLRELRIRDRLRYVGDAPLPAVGAALIPEQEPHG